MCNSYLNVVPSPNANNNFQSDGSPTGNNGSSLAQSHNDQKFDQETKAFPGNIPKVFQTMFDSGKYVHPIQLNTMVKWKCVSEYLSMAKTIQSKIDNYREFLDTAERNVQLNALDAWKHKKAVENEIQDLPNGAREAHRVPFKQLCAIVLGAINNVDVRSQVTLVLNEAEKYTSPEYAAGKSANGGSQQQGFGCNQQSYDGNGNSGNPYGVIGGLPTPIDLEGSGAFDQAMDEVEDSIPHFCPPAPGGPDDPRCSGFPDDLFETPCLKKMRIFGKQPDPNRPAPENIIIASTDDSEEDEKMTSAERRK